MQDSYTLRIAAAFAEFGIPLELPHRRGLPLQREPETLVVVHAASEGRVMDRPLPLHGRRCKPRLVPRECR